MIDHHCHPFETEAGVLDLRGVTLDLVGGPDGDARRDRLRPTFLWYELLRRRLADHLGCAVDEVTDARAEAAQRDYRAYVRGLFADAGLEALIMDPAWPAGAPERVPVFEDLSGCRVHLVFRLDAVVDDLLEGGRDIDVALGAFDAALEESVRKGYRGFKTVLAYRTGLAVDPDVTVSEAAASLRETAPLKRRAKPLRDLLMRRALGFAADRGLPVQVHTGVGDSDLRLSDANPLHLERLLRTPEGSAAPIVLIHGAFPYHEEAAYLCATRPNVHVDFSLFNLFAPATVADRLLRLVELAPTAKVMAGSDGHVAPESHWFATVVARDAWPTVHARLADLGATTGWLAKVEAAVFAGNARELYGL